MGKDLKGERNAGVSSGAATNVAPLFRRVHRTVALPAWRAYRLRRTGRKSPALSAAEAQRERQHMLVSLRHVVDTLRRFEGALACVRRSRRSSVLESIWLPDTARPAGAEVDDPVALANALMGIRRRRVRELLALRLP
ncbi:hypothetical protein [Burkholderia thailandensis]|uniref:hypothetical protein n=1 Tax=Burkholderia thailandensis TaxID=57975 RepID=UPI000752335E|nr:hypothetical protein [Burkholderia thailandensis]KVG15788.1 hypothetical protein WJ25_25120 [Burkholderia thailandensis]MCS6509723.1 hypothetical protein [Burkholderia thailandensis]